LNFGLRHAKGEIIATFDADSVPESDALLRAVEYFSDAKVAALQGRICSINAEENMLTKFLFYEGAVQYEVFLRGKDRLNLYVGLAGTCQFIRRDMLEELGGWNSKSLSEDYELSLRLTEKDYQIKYASDVRTWEESPATFRDLVRQRARWYRGNIELSFKFGKLIKKLSWRRFDAEMTLLGTYVIALCVLNYFMAACVLFVPPNLFLILNLIARFTSLFVLATLFFVGIGLAFLTRPFGFSNLLWLPFMYFYWGFQSFIAVYAILQIVLRRPMKWSRAERSGVVTAEVAKKILETAQ
jgi:cellulose synthase/poly-beta-1,6-N-acetylglucosamine synthase-like glycosyltransferase